MRGLLWSAIAGMFGVVAVIGIRRGAREHRALDRAAWWAHAAMVCIVVLMAGLTAQLVETQPGMSTVEIIVGSYATSVMALSVFLNQVTTPKKEKNNP